MGDYDNYFNESIDLATESANKKKEEKEIEKNIHNAVVKFEEDIIESKESRIKLLVKLLSGSWVLIILLGVALVGLTPLKTAVPYLLRVDNTTGYVDKIEPYNAATGTVNKSVARYFIARFVENREGYEWNTVQSMYDIVESASSNNVFNAYQNYMGSDYSPVKKLSKNLKMNVKVNSITFLDDRTAQVRMTKLITEPDGERAVGYKPSVWRATLTFDFSKVISTEKDRLTNPLGLNVTSYKVDAEVVK